MKFKQLQPCAYAWAAIAMAQAQTPGLDVIHSFGNYPNGATPWGTLARGTDGSFYGTAYSGGAANLGVVFKLDTSGQYKILYNFKGGTDGANPHAGVTIGPDGSLYGTTYLGGPANVGVVYKLDSSGSETVRYSFTGGADGGNPYAGVILDSAGNLYGTTVTGGPQQGGCYVRGCGVVYKVTPSGQETVLYAFQDAPDGAFPQAGVIADAAGNLYGTTPNGGYSRCNANKGCGVVYKIDPSGHETVLYTFTGGSDGTAPAGGVIADTAGNLYGTTDSGGAPPCRCGVIYKLSPSGKETVLYSFTGADDGGEPFTGLARDASGNLYGATEHDGAAGGGTAYKLSTAGVLTVLYALPSGSDQPVHNAGVILDPSGNLYGTALSNGANVALGLVYEVDPTGTEKTLYTFLPAPGGTFPSSSVIRDAVGNFYGTTSDGGAAGAGAVYKIDAAGHESLLYSFTGGTDGAFPDANVILDSAGNIYGTASAGGAGCGVVYKLDAGGHESVLYTFNGASSGCTPQSGVVFDSAGNLYGTACGGGEYYGVVFVLDPSGNETVLHNFTRTDGDCPWAGVTRDSGGNLYGTTLNGGADGAGVIYKLDPSGHETVLYSFTLANGAGTGGPTGAYPYGGVTLDPDGNLYGTTWGGGDLTGAAAGCEGSGCGVVYKLDPSGQFTVLYAFTGGADGGMPGAGVIRDSAGNLFGTTQYGGFDALCVPQAFDGGCGVVFKVDPSGNETVLHAFSGTDGSYPDGIIFGSAGVLYGTAYSGGAANGGVLYKLTLP